MGRRFWQAARAAGRRALAGERGSALLEAGLVLPAVLALAFGVVLCGRLVQGQIGVQAAAREASRTVAVASSAEEGLEFGRARGLAVASGHGLDTARLVLIVDAGDFERGGTARARASYIVALADLPLLGQVDVTVTSSHEERIERYRSRTAALP